MSNRKKTSRPADVSRSAYYNQISIYIDIVCQPSTEDHIISLNIRNIIRALDLAAQHQMDELFIQGTLAFWPFVQQRGLFAVAETYMGRVIDLARQNSDYGLEVIGLLRHGEALNEQGRFDDAYNDLRQGLLGACRLEDTESIIDLKTKLAWVADNLGRYGEALTNYQEALTMLEQQDDKFRIPDILFRLAGLLTNRAQQGDYDQARQYILKGIEIAKNTNNTEKLAELIQRLGVLVNNASDPHEAIPYLRQSVELIRKTKNVISESFFLVNLAEALTKDGQIREANGCLAEAEILIQPLQHIETLAFIKLKRGGIFVAESKFDEAEQEILASLKLAEGIDHHWYKAASLLDLGDLYRVTGRIQEAKQAYEQCVVICQNGGGMSEIIKSARDGLDHCHSAAI